MWREPSGTTTMKRAGVPPEPLLSDVTRLVERVLAVVIFDTHSPRSPTIFATTRFQESRSLPQGSLLYR
jgi:hypothetical protein